MIQDEEELRNKVELALSQRRWGRALPILYREFEESNDLVDRKSVRFGMRAAVACFLLFGCFDLWLFPDVGLYGVLTRMTVGLGFLAIVEWQVSHERSMRTINATCASSLAVAALCWLLVVSHTSHQTNFANFMVFGTVFVLSSSLFFRIRFSVAASSSTLITLLFAFAAVNADVDVSFKVILVVFFFNFLGLALYLSWQLAAERYVTFLNATRAQLNEMADREKGLQLARIANTDHLTGLKNRRAAVQEYDSFRERWLRDGKAIGVLLVDVDHFKAYNDHYGHQSGDRCLIDVGHALQAAAAKAGGILGRYGGEEFLAFTHVSDTDELYQFAESLRKAVEALALPHSQRRDSSNVVTVSIGASITRTDANSHLDRMCSEADNALYSAKANGRNGTHVFDAEASLTDNEDRNLAVILEQAVERDHLSLVYQPIVDVERGGVHAVETLMRLRGPDGVAISPAIFIPVAERTGAIIQLGRWAIRTACSEILAAGVAKKVSVNVSPVQLREASFALFVAGVLTEMKLAPSALALEITEGFDIASDSKVLQTVSALQRIGVEIWLDDFGTGYAGLSWLQAVEFTLVKIDQRFLHNCETEEGAKFLQDILQLVRNRGLSVVLEGVETQEQMDYIKKANVPFAQGFYLGRPAPVEGPLAAPGIVHATRMG
ncbi:putative bifunctional diguanylate cyclase/phosphodiesterase [Jiella pacifica]|uniref:EAL domain-containing protein n=1 Tax=Jiella pacifica TaxID=2696469 RepID=A0A6N9SXX3_9HYPH|nr:GGDEF domain-containing phosphodiesterase [Jiella pacifica]NDW03914.1 EAL domain-containing protein [Jiella pacifica]